MKTPKQVKQLRKFIQLCDDIFHEYNTDPEKDYLDEKLYEFVFSGKVSKLCSWFEDMVGYVYPTVPDSTCIEDSLAKLEQLREYLRQWELAYSWEDLDFDKRFEDIFK